MLIVYSALQNLAPTQPYSCHSPKTPTFSTALTFSWLHEFHRAFYNSLPLRNLFPLPGGPVSLLRSPTARQTVIRLSSLCSKITSWVKSSPIDSGENSHSLLRGIFLYFCYCSSHILWCFTCLLFSSCYTVNNSRTGTMSLTFIYPESRTEAKLEKALGMVGERGGQWPEHNNGPSVTLNIQR